MAGKIEMGLYLFVSPLGPFLYKGLTLPSFHLSGKVELIML